MMSAATRRCFSVAAAGASTSPPLRPPFTLATATAKVRAAQDLWNSQDPDRVALAYTEDTIWRNRDEFLSGRAAVRAFLRRKWERELDYRLRKELFCFADDRVAVQFFYEYRNASGGDGSGWRRCYGLEHWTFDRESGLMRERRMSGNDVAIAEADRWFRDGDLVRGPDPPFRLD